MGEFVQSFIEESKRKNRQALMEKLGVYEIEKEFAPDNATASFCRTHGYNRYMTTDDGRLLYYKEGAKIYPELSDEEFDELLKIAQQQELLSKCETGSKQQSSAKPVAERHTDMVLSPEYTQTDGSSAGKFMRGLAVVTWILGVISAIVLSIQKEIVSGYYSSKVETTFNWSTFITVAVIYFVAGGLLMCMSEVCNNIDDINIKLSRFRLQDRSDKK